MYQTNNLYVLTSTNWSTKVLTLNPQIYIFSSQKYTNIIDAESQVYQCTAMTHLVAHTNVPMHSNGTSHHATHKWTNALADQWLPHHACPVDTVAGSTRIQTLCCHRLWEPAGFIFEDFNNFIQHPIFTSYSVYSLWSSMAHLFPKFSFYLVIIPCLWIAAVKPDRGIKRA